MSTFVLYLLSASVAYILTAAALPLLQRYTLRQLADKPGGLKTHKRPVSAIGGSGILVGVLGSLTLIRLCTNFPSGTLHNLRGIFIGGALIFVMGILDDARKPEGLPVAVKLLFQAAATVALIYYDVVIHVFTTPWLSIPLTFLWVVGLTNAFNLLDIMDGLCVSQAVVCTLGLAVIALPSEFIYVNFAALALLGACLAFWPHNHAKKHKIFLGDSGSNLLGFLIAAISLGTGYSSHSDLGFLAPLFILAVPLFDTFFVSLARILKGKNPLKGSNDHAALRLKTAGWKPTRVILAFIGTGLFFNSLAFALTRCTSLVALALFLMAFLLAAVCTFWLLMLRTS